MDCFLRANAKLEEMEGGRAETGCWFSAVSFLMGAPLNTKTGENDLENTSAQPIGSMYPMEVAQVGWLEPPFHFELEISISTVSIKTLELISDKVEFCDR